MDSTGSRDHHIKRIVLPSGKTIEVVYFSDGIEDGPAGPARERAGDAGHAPATGLHVCPRCESTFVHPTDWEEAGRERWRVSLRCPDCEWHGSGIFSQELVDWFDEELDRGTEALVRDLKRLTRANIEDEIERFVRALEADAILPEDF
jgi:hypothetical protein